MLSRRVPAVFAGPHRRSRYGRAMKTWAPLVLIACLYPAALIFLRKRGEVETVRDPSAAERTLVPSRY